VRSKYSDHDNGTSRLGSIGLAPIEPIGWTIAVQRFSLSTRIFIAFAVVVATFGAAAFYGAATVSGLRHELGFLRQRAVPMLRTLKSHSLELRGFDEALQRAAPHDLDWVARFVPNAKPFVRLDRILRRLSKLTHQARAPGVITALLSPPPPLPDVGQELRLLRSSKRASKRIEGDAQLKPLLSQGPPLQGDEQAFNALVKALQRAVADKRYTDASRLVVEVRRVVRRIHRGVDRAERKLQLALDDRFEVAQQSEARLGLIVLTSTSVALGVSVLMLWVMLWTLKPMASLANVVRRFASGERGARADTGGAREIRQLALEYNRMADALAERERELVSHRDELARSERLATLGHMAARVVHEIRNPLSSIGLNAEMLSEELDTLQPGVDEPPSTISEAQELLGAIGGEVERLREITEGYLQSARSAPQIETSVDIGGLVREQAEFVRAELRERGVSIELYVEADVIANVDPKLIRQALWNLVRNGWEAMPKGGVLWLEAFHAGVPGQTEVAVAVEDSGEGIAVELRERIFEPFMSTKPSGTGVGLALVAEVAKAHGGRAEVATPRHGKGARIELILAAPKHA